MRIAFLGPSYPWRGGIAQFAQNMALKLCENEHEVMMFTFIHQYPALFFPASEQTETALSPPKLATQKILTPYNPWTWLTAIQDIKGWNPDVIIVSYWLPVMAPAFGFILRGLKKVRKLYLIHNIKFHEKWLFADKLTRYAMRPADGYITLSDTSARALQETNITIDSHKLLSLFHPVYEQLFIKNDKVHSHLFRILFFGFVKHYKGLDVLLNALPIVLKELPQIKLVIAGDIYGVQKPYREMIENLNLKDNVEAHFRYISDEEIEGFFTGCDVCILPYRSATQSGVAQMAFAYDVPVIASNVGGIEEVVRDGENGLLVEPENTQALADKIVEFYQKDYAEQFRNAIRKNNEQYSWDVFTQKLLEFLA
jgi:glycosyltransferase involved in cell wall biosynthesis